MMRDFGPGLTVDELIGMTAWHIDALELPKGLSFQFAQKGARVMVEAEMESFILAEIWEDGHTVWNSLKKENPAVVTPTGQLIRTH